MWAESNTSGAILEAFTRREVYASSGPRIRVHFFAGWDFDAADLEAFDPALGYTRGVPVGGQLTRVNSPTESAPQFLITALKDPESGNRSLNEKGQLPEVGDTVDRRTGQTADTIGAPSLQALWQDPDFNPAQGAFY